MSSAKDNAAPIIIRRSRKSRHGGGHAGGMWKIAYADFVTAMMAFFLLMWLLTTSAQADLQGISEYFRTPLKVVLTAGKVAGDPVSLLTGGERNVPKTRQQRDAQDQQRMQQIQQQSERQRERAKLEQLKTSIQQLIMNQDALRQFKDQILIDFTDEGLRIQIVDEKNRPMFDTGKTALKDYSKAILDQLAKALNQVDNKISISGHTDSAPYAGGEAGYSNWELSADRANAARREMLAAGMAADKALRVVGLADSLPLVKGDLSAAENRRISIVVLNKRSEEFLKRGGISDGLKKALEPAAPDGKADGSFDPGVIMRTSRTTETY